jgi:hypothetical protein
MNEMNLSSPHRSFDMTSSRLFLYVIGSILGAFLGMLTGMFIGLFGHTGIEVAIPTGFIGADEILTNKTEFVTPTLFPKGQRGNRLRGY